MNTNIIDFNGNHVIPAHLLPRKITDQSQLPDLAAVQPDWPLTFQASEVGCAFSIIITAVHSCCLSTAGSY